MEKTTQNGITVLTAGPGMRLTNGETFGSVVCLGVHDSESNWQEITEAQARAIEEARVNDL